MSLLSKTPDRCAITGKRKPLEQARVVLTFELPQGPSLLGSLDLVEAALLVIEPKQEHIMGPVEGERGARFSIIGFPRRPGGRSPHLSEAQSGSRKGERASEGRGCVERGTLNADR